MNHLTAGCKVTTDVVPAPNMESVCRTLGMVPLVTSDGYTPVVYGTQYIAVYFNGKLIGRVLLDHAQAFVDQLRLAKLENTRIPSCTEIVFIKPEEQTGGPCPAVYLSTDAARMQRVVRHLGTNKEELIGAMEQIYLDIACVEEDIRKGETTHIETSPSNMLSLIASLTPFSDFNQSPRNMYQCQVRMKIIYIMSRWVNRLWVHLVCHGFTVLITRVIVFKLLKLLLFIMRNTAIICSIPILRV